MRPVRLFVSVETPSAVRRQISEIIETLRRTKASVRWEEPEKLHATIKFLGNTAGETIPAVRDILMTLARTVVPFPVRYTRPGVFPNLHRPRVLWIGMDDPTGSMTSIQRSAEVAFSAIGFQPEERKFTPHVTIGRVRDAKRIRLLLEEMETLTLDGDQVLVGELALVKSDLNPAGSQHTVLERFPLGEATPR